MKSSIIIGTGGHGRVILSILFSNKINRIRGFIDLNHYDPTERIMGVPVIGDPDILTSIEPNDNEVYLAIGDNKLREEWYNNCLINGFRLPNLISRLSYLDDTVSLGEANVICPNAYVGPEVVIGNNNIINTSSIVEHEVKIGSNSHVCPNAVVAGRSELMNSVFIGAGSVVIDGIYIESGTIVGAGSTVIRNVPEKDTTIAGSPARSVS